MLLCGMEYGLWPSWIGKHTLFRPPLGWLMRLLRGIPIDRSAPQNMVQQMAELFQSRDQHLHDAAVAS